MQWRPVGDVQDEKSVELSGIGNCQRFSEEIKELQMDAHPLTDEK